MIKFKVAIEFSRTPGVRSSVEGPHSGQEFRDYYLLPKLQEARAKNDKLLVDLDGSAGYSTSFLEESFGGLIRNKQFTYYELKSVLKLKSDEDPSYIDEINQYIEDAHKNKSSD